MSAVHDIVLIKGTLDTFENSPYGGTRVVVPLQKSYEQQAAEVYSFSSPHNPRGIRSQPIYLKLG
jgi:hypothetical protein